NGHRAGKGAFHMPKLLALQRRFRQCGAIDGYKGLIPARAVEVNGARDQLFSRAALAADQDRAVGLGNTPDQREYFLHSLADRDDVFETSAFLELAFEQ